MFAGVGLRETIDAHLARTARGDEQAFGSLYDALSGRVYGLALRILGDPAAAEEATLDTFTQVWNTAGRYDPKRGSVATWVLTIARSRALDLKRAQARRASRENALEAGGDPTAPGPDPVAAYAMAEEAVRVRGALATLPDDQRACIETAFFGGLSYSDTAAALGQPLGTVKTRIRTGLATLRAVLAEVSAT